MLMMHHDCLISTQMREKEREKESNVIFRYHQVSEVQQERAWIQKYFGGGDKFCQGFPRHFSVMLHCKLKKYVRRQKNTTGLDGIIMKTI